MLALEMKRTESVGRMNSSPMGRTIRSKSLNMPSSPSQSMDIAWDWGSNNQPGNLAPKHRITHSCRVDYFRTIRRNSSSQEKRAVQQSLVPFREMSISPNYVMEPPPVNLVRRPFWIMRLIHETIAHGGYLSSRLFVPKGVWTQVGVKFFGASQKISAMEALMEYVMNNAVMLPTPYDFCSCKCALAAAKLFREQAIKLQSDLCRTFPYVGGMDGIHRAGNSRRNFLKINNMVRTIGRNMKISASNAYDRMGSSTKGSNDGDLSYYGLLVSGVCEKCQVFDMWLESALNLYNGSNSRETSSAASDLISELQQISNILREAFIEIVLRDIEMLVDRYVRKMRKSFARMNWDLDSTI